MTKNISQCEFEKKGGVDLSESQPTFGIAIVPMNRSIFSRLHTPKIDQVVSVKLMTFIEDMISTCLLALIFKST